MLARIWERLKLLTERDARIIRRIERLEGRVRVLEREKLDQWK